jgi:glycosyltransferase involved in cell wall biosynthesis
MNKIHLSIITLSYNQANFIFQNISSVKSHLNSGVEHIFIDPGSQDGSREIINSYFESHPNVVRVFEPDTGPGNGLNKGIQIARGEWIAILNADDYYVDGSLSKFLSVISKSNKYDILYGYGILLEGSTLRKIHVGRLNLRNFALGQQQIFQPSIFFRKSKIIETNTIFNELNNTCWDAEFIFDLIKYGSAKVKRLPVHFSVFRLHPNSISGSQENFHQYQKDIEEITRKAKIGRNYKWDRCVNALEKNSLLKLGKKIIVYVLKFNFLFKTYLFKFIKK